MIYSARIVHFLIPAWNFQDMLAIGIASKKSWDTSSTYTGIQDGGQNLKWLPAMYIVVEISLSLHYKVHFHGKMYAVKDTEFEYINSKWNEHQYGHQIQGVFQNWPIQHIKDFVLNNYIQLPYIIMQISAYIGNIYSLEKITGHKFHLYRNPRWRSQFKIDANNL